jgi:putative endonuclease
MFYTYVLQSLKDKKMYIGYSANLKNRIKQHLSGLVLSTKGRLPIRLIFYEAFVSKGDAMRREQYFKTTAGKKALKLMLRESLRSIIAG